MGPYLVRAKHLSVIIDSDMTLITGRLDVNGTTDIAWINGVLAFAEDDHRFLRHDTRNVVFEEGIEEILWQWMQVLFFFILPLEDRYLIRSL